MDSFLSLIQNQDLLASLVWVAFFAVVWIKGLGWFFKLVVKLMQYSLLDDACDAAAEVFPQFIKPLKEAAEDGKLTDQEKLMIEDRYKSILFNKIKGNTLKVLAYAFSNRDKIKRRAVGMVKKRLG